MYFKNFVAENHRFPLVDIEFNTIERVERVSINFPSKKKEDKQLNQFQFEIFIKKADCLSSVYVPHNYIEESKVNLEELNLNEARAKEDPDFAVTISRRKFTNQKGTPFEVKMMQSPERRNRLSRINYKEQCGT